MPVPRLSVGKVFHLAENLKRENFIFRDTKYPLFDIWGMSCEHLLNNDDYKRMCIENNWITASGNFFKTSAETAFRFHTGEMEFDEAHTALDDAIIESELLRAILQPKAGNMQIGIMYFPFKILGKVENFSY